MKEIKIAERLRPFSHSQQTECLLPGTSILLKIYPSQVDFYDMSSFSKEKIYTLYPQITGPLESFTVCQDLEQSLVKVWGKDAEYPFSYTLSLSPCKQSCLYKIKFDKALKKESNLPFPIHQKVFPTWQERLSLGSHKKQDWDLLYRRNDMTEFIPLFLRLAELTPQGAPVSSSEGTHLLLNNLAQAIDEKNRATIKQHVSRIVQAAFSGMLVPQLEDSLHLGLNLPAVSDSKISALTVLHSYAQELKRLFFEQETDGTFSLLPLLPPELHCGRYIGLRCAQLGTLHFEWSKKLMRRALFIADKDGLLTLNFQKSLKSFRLRKGKEKQGRTVLCGQSIELNAGQAYSLDHFCK